MVCNHQTNFRCSLHTYIYIYSNLHFLIYTYFLILTYIYLFILLFSLYYYMNLMKLLKWGSKETTTKFSRLKSIFSIEDNYPFTLVICLFSSLFTITKEVNHPLLWRKCSLKLNLKKSEFSKGFFVCFRLSLYNYKEKLIFYGEENVHWN